MLSLAEITEHEIVLISNFLALLKRENSALNDVEPSRLTEISSAKNALLEQLNALESSRGQALGIGPEADIRSTMETWLASHPDQLATAANWQKLLELAHEAKSLHETNGQLVRIHLQQTNEILAVLTSLTQKDTLYGCDGQTAPSTGSRIVDSA